MKSIVLLVLILLVGGGVFLWHNSNVKAKRIAEARQAIETAEHDIEQYQKKIAEIKVEREQLSAELTTAKKVRDDLTREFRDKTAAVEEGEIKLKDLRSPNSSSPGSANTRSGNSAENEIKRLEQEVKKLDCHFNCMKKAKKPRKAGDRYSTREGEWCYIKGVSGMVWRCAVHGFIFSKRIDYLDYRAEKLKAERSIEELKNEQELKSKMLADAQKKQAEEKEQADEQIRILRAEIRNAKNEANDLKRNLGDCEEKIDKLESKDADLEDEIDDLEDKIEKCEKLIAEKQKIIG